MITDEKAAERRVREELYARAVDAVALRLRTAETYKRRNIYSGSAERLRDVAGVMVRFASELLGVSPCDVWEDARKRAGALDA